MTLAAYPISELPPTQAGLFAVAGMASIAVAIFNQKFYWAKGVFPGGKEAPLWFGRIIFGTLGLLFFSVGVYNLLPR